MSPLILFGVLLVALIVFICAVAFMATAFRRSMLKFLIVVMLLAMVGVGQDITVLDDKPIIFPQELPKAISLVDLWAEELAVMATHADFLRDNESLNVTGLFVA